MALKAIHDSKDEIPEQFQELYTEKNDKWELTGITGVKTQADIDRLSSSLEKERAAHKETKELFSPWRDMNHEEIMSKLDRMPELEAAASGKLNEAEIEEIVAKRVEGTIKSKTSPLERQIETFQKERETLLAENESFKAQNKRRTIHDAVRASLTEAKVLSTAHEDALMLAERVFEISDDGKVITRDQVNVTPGVAPEVWLTEMQDKRPHWWPETRGGGAPGGKGGGGLKTNPWSKDNWNVTEQHRIAKAEGMDTARQYAQAAGSDIGATAPPQ
jgi:hypothetical protein